MATTASTTPARSLKSPPPTTLARPCSEPPLIASPPSLQGTSRLSHFVNHRRALTGPSSVSASMTSMLWPPVWRPSEVHRAYRRGGSGLRDPRKPALPSQVRQSRSPTKAEICTSPPTRAKAGHAGRSACLRRAAFSSPEPRGRRPEFRSRQKHPTGDFFGSHGPRRAASEPSAARASAAARPRSAANEAHGLSRLRARSNSPSFARPTHLHISRRPREPHRSCAATRNREAPLTLFLREGRIRNHQFEVRF
jgi:hypothetical protein